MLWRSHAPAPEELIEHYQNDKLLDAITAASEGFPNHKEQVLLGRQRCRQRQLVEGQW